ncbi:Uncharacterised protein [Enterobacter cancerogenus]|uniref:Uncharacterized protein n=1 Tax=Enterobacter cancerogenus TaxID=69218 RepID=A0A484XCY3_9ENTR|nr:Uncharacterised protein [Enterobacter cancerogenus]
MSVVQKLVHQGIGYRRVANPENSPQPAKNGDIP